MLELILGPFGSGKTTLLVNKCGPGALCITYSKALKCNALKRNAHHKLTVQTLDSFIALYYGSGCLGQDFAGKRTAFVTSVVPPTWGTVPTLLAIDDADIFHPTLLARLVFIAHQGHIPCVITSRQPLPYTFEHTHRLSTCVRCPVAHQRLLQLLFHKGSSTSPADPLVAHATGPLLVPYTNAARLVEEVLPYLQTGTVILCNNPQMLRTMELHLLGTPWRVGRFIPNAVPPDIMLSSVTAFYGLEAARVVLIADALPLPLVVEGLTRATTFLAVAFDSHHPPPLFSQVAACLASYLVPNMAWINWEYTAPVSALLSRPSTLSTSLTPTSSLTPASSLTPLSLPPSTLLTSRSTVTQLVAILSAQCQALDDPQTVLTAVATQLQWLAVPRLARPVVYQQHWDFPPIVLEQQLTAVAGRVSELLLNRELCFLEPKALWVLPPSAVVFYRDAWGCDDLDFLQQWWQQPLLIYRQGSQQDWHTEFRRSRWGNNTALHTQLADWLATHPAPHYLIPTAVTTPEMRQAVAQAVEDYTNLDTPVLAERSWWVLGALEHFFNSMQHRQQGSPDWLPLTRVCVCWHQLKGAEGFFKGIAQRVRHFLISLDARYLEEQVLVKTATLTGAADFVVNNNLVVELKTSSKRWDNAWLIQAALYAHTLRRPEAHVFNVLNGSHARILFDENLFY